VEPAELEGDAERVDRFAVPVGEQRDAKVERLGPRDVGVRRVARDPEGADTQLLELRAPVTQELEFVRSGPGPVEEIEEDERRRAGEELREPGGRVRSGPHRHVRDGFAHGQHGFESR